MEKWQWAWLGGLFEGEGCIAFSGKCCVQLRVSMTDRDVIETLERLCPSATRRISTKEYEHKKTQWAWTRTDRDEVKHFLEGTLPYLHGRRGDRARAALERLTHNPGAKAKRTHCNYGHPLSGENLYVARTTGSRSCKICRTRRDRERQRP